MTIKEQLRSNFPHTVNKDGKIFSALIANDSGSAAIEKTLTDMKAYMTEWTSTPDIYKQTGDMLEKSGNFLTYLTKFTDETDQSYKNRISAIFIRNKDKKWGTPLDIKNVFKQYFSSGNIFLLENTNSVNDNLLVDGDFEEDSSSWIMNNCSISTDARFSKTKGLLINQSNAECYQTVTFDHNKDTTYFFHFFAVGKVGVIIQDVSNNKFWDKTNEVWTESKKVNVYSNLTEWKNFSIWFRCSTDQEKIKISFTGIDSTESYVDYCFLYEKQLYSSFTVIAQFEGSSSQNSVILGDNKSPETSSEAFDRYSFWDNTFMNGVSTGFAKDIYEDLLQYLKATGVKAYLELVTRDYKETN